MIPKVLAIFRHYPYFDLKRTRKDEALENEVIYLIEKIKQRSAVSVVS
jgi:hypothetical protein